MAALVIKGSGCRGTGWIYIIQYVGRDEWETYCIIVQLCGDCLVKLCGNFVHTAHCAQYMRQYHGKISSGKYIMGQFVQHWDALINIVRNYNKLQVSVSISSATVFCGYHKLYL